MKLFGCFFTCFFFGYCTSTSVIKQNNFRAIVFGEHVDKRALEGHVLQIEQVQNEMQCQLHCVRNGRCISYNMGPLAGRKRSCELNAAERYGRPNEFVPKPGYIYRQVKTTCDYNPCGVNETCIPDYEKDSHVCKLAVKLNVNPLCFSAKGTGYGSVTSPIELDVAIFRLAYISGYVNCVSSPNYNSNWGCKGMSIGDLNMAITDGANKVIAPDVPIPQATFYGYFLAGFHANSPTLDLRTISAPYTLKKGAEIRVWYTQDLYKYGHLDNHGRACADVLAIRLRQ